MDINFNIVYFYMDKIRRINRSYSTASEREAALKDLLRTQSILLGLIMSGPTGMAIGTIKKDGSINHCDAKYAQSPYRILVKPTTGDRVPLAGTVRYAQVLGRCVDLKGKTIAEIVRQNDRNRMVLTDKSSAPVIATVLPSEGRYSTDERLKADNSNLDQLIRESQALIDSLRT
jgi:hypothetical protein